VSGQPTGAGADPIVAQLRGEIDALDAQLLRAVNRRLEVVRRLHDHKQDAGYPLYDAGREAALLAFVCQANTGPLSEEGVRMFFQHVIELTRRELHGG
jgi:chorismate mutase